MFVRVVINSVAVTHSPPPPGVPVSDRPQASGGPAFGYLWSVFYLPDMCEVGDESRIPHLAQTRDAVNRQLSCFSSRYMNLLAVLQI